MKLSDADLEDLLLNGGDERVERLDSLSGGAKAAAAEAVCAFSNDLPDSGKPGVAFVGVASDGAEPSGFAVDEQALRTLAAMKTDGRITPPPSMFVERRTVAGLPLAVATVVPSTSPPVRFDGRIHVRTGRRRGVATLQEESLLNERRRRLDLPFDARPLFGTSIDSLYLRDFEVGYLPSAFRGADLRRNDRSLEQRLAALKMIASEDDPTPTALGVMALGTDPRRHIACDYVQFLRIDGCELSDPIVDELMIEGTLSEILNRLDDKLRASITVAVDFTSSRLETRRSSYPVDALRRLARNAVMHRAYEGTNAPVGVTWFRDRVEIRSPGGPFGLVTRENFGRPGVADYRNPNVADAMKTLGHVRGFGGGIAAARALLADAGHPEPEFAVDDTHVAVTVRGKPSQAREP